MNAAVAGGRGFTKYAPPTASALRLGGDVGGPLLGRR